MEEAQYKTLKNTIRYCKDPRKLDQLVQQIMAPTGFGSNSLADTEDPIGLDYREMAECLQDTDRNYFQYEIELVLDAYYQQDLIEQGSVPEEPPTVNPWEMFM